MELRFFKYILVCSTIIILNSGCTTQEPVPDDDEILEKAYSSYKIPEGFYQENLEGGSIYYNNTLSILPLEERTSSSIQLSTDDRDQAREWSEATSQNSSYYRKLVEESETEKYFQFKRVYERNPSDIILSRVHKKSYLDRSMYDFFNPGTVLGKYNKKPYQINEVKELVEYLWFVENYNINGRKVLESSISEDWSAFNHTLKEIKIIYGDWDMRDEIIVLETTYYVYKSDGKISINEKEIRKIKGKNN